MAYGTPTFDYEQARSGLAQQKGLQDVTRDYGRFLSQERFRRRNMDEGNRFRDSFPQVGSRFNRRGLWNSGLRRQAQTRAAQDFSETQARSRFDQAASETGVDMEAAASDAAYQAALLSLVERLQAGRAAGFDPFAGVR